jgi:hypothetical protein
VAALLNRFRAFDGGCEVKLSEVVASGLVIGGGCATSLEAWPSLRKTVWKSGDWWLILRSKSLRVF